VVLVPVEGKPDDGGAAPAPESQQPLLSLTIVSQPGLLRRQVYYPFISFRVSRTLQVRNTPPGGAEEIVVFVRSG
jgi:hypothetical protein